MRTRITFVGPGEAAGAPISGWGAARWGIAAYDIKLADPATRAGIASRAEALGVALFDTPAGAVGCADLVFSTVTADRAVIAAETGGRRVDVAMLAQLHPKRNMVPWLPSRPHTAASGEPAPTSAPSPATCCRPSAGTDRRA